MIQVGIIGAYLLGLVALGIVAGRRLASGSSDFFLASRGIGPFFLLMSLFGTTMTAFALVGSTGKAYLLGIGTFGLMASWSALVHPAMFLLVGVPVWRLGKKHGFVTQVQLLRARYGSDLLGAALFPVLVLLVVPYLLIGVQGAGATVAAVTKGVWADGVGLPAWLTGLVVCAVVLSYVWLGGMRAAAWANALQTTIFLVVASVAFVALASALGGPAAATAATAAKRPELLVRGGLIEPLHWLSYGFVPLSVGMFPHLFQHWLTARSGRSFQLSVVLHPVLIMAVWLPCVLIGVWAAGQLSLPPEKANAVLGVMVARFTAPWMSGVLTAGVLAAIMSSLDSQFLSLGTMFTHDVLLRWRPDLDERAQVLAGRGFVLAIVGFTYVLSLFESRSVFDLGVWTFSGFAWLTPLILAALYWPRANAGGALLSLAVTASLWTVMFAYDLAYGPVGSEELLFFGAMPAAWLVIASAAAMAVGTVVGERVGGALAARQAL